MRLWKGQAGQVPERTTPDGATKRETRRTAGSCQSTRSNAVDRATTTSTTREMLLQAGNLERTKCDSDRQASPPTREDQRHTCTLATRSPAG